MGWTRVVPSVGRSTGLWVGIVAKSVSIIEFAPGDLHPPRPSPERGSRSVAPPSSAIRPLMWLRCVQSLASQIASNSNYQTDTDWSTTFQNVTGAHESRRLARRNSWVPVESLLDGQHGLRLCSAKSPGANPFPDVLARMQPHPTPSLPIGRGSGRPWPVAYHCPSCDKEEEGPPRCNWAVLFQRAVGSDPAGCASRRAGSSRFETAIRNFIDCEQCPGHPE